MRDSLKFDVLPMGAVFTAKRYNSDVIERWSVSQADVSDYREAGRINYEATNVDPEYIDKLGRPCFYQQCFGAEDVIEVLSRPNVRLTIVIETPEP